MTGSDRSVTGQVFTFTEALTLTPWSESTLRRHLLKDGSRLGATKHRRGWSIPIETLHALGALPVTVTGGDRSPGDRMRELEDEVQRLRHELELVRVQLEAAREVSAVQERAMRLLEAVPSSRRRWWRRS